jgi:WS/DGAT/MGAT family acyltransferase
VWTARPAPTDAQLVRDEAARRLRGSLAIGRGMMRALSDPRRGLARMATAAGGLLRLARHGLTSAPPTPFNQPIGPHRRVTWLDVDLERLRHAKQCLGGTLNDVVLACVAGALRPLLLRRRQLPVQGIIRAAVPVSVRTHDEAGDPGNRVSIWIVPLPVYERDACARVAAVHGVTEQLKGRNDAAGAAMLTQAADWTGGALRSWAVRLVGNAHIYNLIVTNVPGPPVPLYLLGARMLAAYPHLPLFENQGLGIALLSYCNRLYIGLTADWSQGPLVAELADELECVVAELPLEESESARPRPARASRRVPPSRAAVHAGPS